MNAIDTSTPKFSLHYLHYLPPGTKWTREQIYEYTRALVIARIKQLELHRAAILHKADTLESRMRDILTVRDCCEDLDTELMQIVTDYTGKLCEKAERIEHQLQCQHEIQYIPDLNDTMARRPYCIICELKADWFRIDMPYVPPISSTVQTSPVASTASTAPGSSV